MPNYHYKCDNCEYEFEVYQSIKDKIKKKCPECKKHKLERIIHSITVNIAKEPKTIGHLAGRNRDSMGKIEYADKLQKEVDSRIPQKEKPKKPWWRTEDKPLNVSKIKSVKKYIETGNKD